MRRRGGCARVEASTPLFLDDKYVRFRVSLSIHATAARRPWRNAIEYV